MPHRTVWLALLAAALLSGAYGIGTWVAQAAPARPRAASGCAKLAVTPALEDRLRSVHKRQLARFSPRTKATGPVGTVYYGRCPKAHYALASFKHRTAQVDFGTQDQPERFRRRNGDVWRDRGDTGGDACGTAPRPLLELWGFGDCPSG